MPGLGLMGLGLSAGRGGTAVAAVTIAADTFTRADSTTDLGTTETGSKVWTQKTGTWGISSNAAYTSTFAGTGIYTLAIIDAGTADCSVAVTIGAIQHFGPAIRVTDANNFLTAEVSSGDITLYKVQGGGFTNLGTYTAPMTVGDVVKLTAAGSTLSVFHNGVARIAASSSFGSAVTTHGLAISPGGSPSTARFNDFTLTTP